MTNKKDISIVDYGVGNIRSVQRAFEAQDCTVNIISTREAIQGADVLVLPGQGSFQSAMKHLNPLKNEIKSHISKNKPYFGICLGLQVLFETSFEDGEVDGLGIFKGTVEKFPSSNLKVPHMGWNNVNVKHDSKHLLSNLGPSPYLYFVHSYFVKPQELDLISTTTDYGINFVSSIQKGALYACQFHPEKSGDVGQGLIRNFIKAL